MTTFWFFGIHGANMVSIVVTPITTAALAVNAEAYATGQPLPEIFAGAINSVFGNWITYTAFLIIMIFVCKSSQLKSIGKIASVPTLFNINDFWYTNSFKYTNIYTTFIMFNYKLYNCLYINGYWFLR